LKKKDTSRVQYICKSFKLNIKTLSTLCHMKYLGII